MAYAAYVLSDGTEAGYGVEAPCDAKGCDTLVWRGVDALCGERPGENEPGEAGCGRWHCSAHQPHEDHGCAFPECGVWSEDETEVCLLVRGHEGEHRDRAGFEFAASAR